MENVYSDKVLNHKWRNYFNWVVVIPVFYILGLGAITMYAIANLFRTGINGMSYRPISDSMQDWGQAMVGNNWVSYAFIAMIPLLAVGYWVWFFVATDNLLARLKLHRPFWNVLNVVLFILSGGSGILNIIVTAYIWFKVREHWNKEGVHHSWRSVAVEKELSDVSSNMRLG